MSNGCHGCWVLAIHNAGEGIQVHHRCVRVGYGEREALTPEHMEEDDAETRALPEWVRLE